MPKWDEWFRRGEDYFDDSKPDLFDVLGFRVFQGDFDERASDLFWNYLSDRSPQTKAELETYLQDEYGIDFDEEFDFEDFRSFYENA